MMSTRQPHTAPAHILRRIAVIADTDPRSVQRLLRGEMVRPMVRDRIERALVELKLFGRVGKDTA